MIVRARTIAVLTLFASLFSSIARANGRFPTASHLAVGPGDDDRLFVLRTTFGLALSRDHGARWSWVCEEALDAVGEFDPAVALAADGAITLGLPAGLRVSGADHCVWNTPRDTPTRVLDVTQSASGELLLAAAGAFVDGATPYSLVLRSDDRGATWRVSARLDRFFIETVDLAPRAPERVYVSGTSAEARPTILRSDDGATRFAPTAASLPPNATAYLAAVSHANPDRLWVRTTEGLGSALYRSDDGGASLTRIAASDAPMTAFAVSDDDRRVWWGTSQRASGIQRSIDGRPFAPVGPPISLRCMRFHRGTLFVCADEGADGFSLGWSRDGGEHVSPMMSLRDLEGPLQPCEVGGVTGRCAAPWSALAPRLAELDAAASPARVTLDASSDGYAEDLAAQGDTRADGSAARPASREGCGCGVATPRARGVGGWALCAAVWSARRRRQGALIRTVSKRRVE